MIYENNSDLRDLLRRGVSGDAVHELVSAKSFVLADVEFAAAVAEVKAQHSSHSDAEAEARAAYRLLTSPLAADGRGAIVIHSRCRECAKWTKWAASAAWPWVKIAWAVTVLVLLMAMVARGQERSADTAAPRQFMPVTRSAKFLAHFYPEPDAPGSVIIQLQNQGTVLATRPAGIVSFNCTTNMTCSFSGSTFTLTSSGGSGGTAHNLLSSTHTDTTPATVVRGDLITGQTATPVWQRLALGSNNQVLESNGTDAQWLTLGKPQLPATAVYTDQANTYSAGDQNMAAAASHELPVGAGCTAGATNGRVCFDSTQETPHYGDAVMGDTTAVRVLCSKFSTTDQKTDSVATEQVFATTCAIPANALIANKQILIHVGFQAITIASPPTFLLKARIEKAGPTDVYFFTQTAAVAPAASATRDFAYDFTLIGTGAPNAAASIELDKTDDYNAGNVMNNTSSPITADTTAQQTVQITATWGTAGAGSNKLNVRILRVMVAN